MVNLTGRSKGCSTCRRRKIKCDETRPICNRCQKSGLECDGPKETVFVQGKIIKPRGSGNEPAEASSSQPSQGTEGDLSGPPLTISAPLQGNQYERYIMYLQQHLMKGAPVDAALQESQLSDIIAARTSTSNSQVFNQAVLSFATILFGTSHKQTAIVNEGFAMHGKALQQLNHALSDAQNFRAYEVLLAVCTFGMLEYLVPTGPDNYLKHMLGLERLFQLRGPASFVTVKDLIFVSCCRYMNIFASMSMGKPSIFARPEWKVVLRKAPSHDDPLDIELWDILADCTVLIANGDDLAKRWNNTAELRLERDDLRNRALNVVNALNDWKSRWMSDERTSISEIPLNSVAPQYMEEEPGETIPTPFLIVLSFTNDWTVMILMAFDMTLIRVLQVLSSLPSEETSEKNSPQPIHGESSNAVQEDDPMDISDDGYVDVAREAALEICRCIPYSVSQTGTLASSDSSPVIHKGIATALEVLGGDSSAEGRWVLKYMKSSPHERKTADQSAM